MNTTLETYNALSHLRENDIYLPDMDKEQIIADFFPPSFQELIQRLSDITGAFYGGMLQQAGLLFGYGNINQLSGDFLYDLGFKTVLRYREIKPGLPEGFEFLARIFIGTVFTSSPEFTFEFLELNEKSLQMRIKGTDRYHKIATKFQIKDYLEWPVLKPFIQGICDAMKLNVSILMDVVELNEDSTCVYLLKIKSR